MRRIQIHPSSSHGGGGGGRTARRQAAAAEQPVVYTVWKRSSIGFQGTDGFSVYDSAGKLAFRVDNYSRRRKAFAGDLLLMDGHGTPLLSLRPQILSLHNRWNCYRAQEEEGLDSTSSPTVSQQVFSMRKGSALQSSDEAEVFMSTRSSDHNQPDASPSPSFRIDGCFSMRSCKIRGNNGKEAARIMKKNAGVMSRPVSLGDDVFTLVVRPGFDVAVVMAMVVVMDRICRRPYTPMVCSSSLPNPQVWCNSHIPLQNTASQIANQIVLYHLSKVAAGVSKLQLMAYMHNQLFCSVYPIISMALLIASMMQR